MAKRGSIKKVFPGGNTSKGFYSFYDYIVPENAARIFVLKGGPGVGKSSFMRTIGEEFLRQGYDVEQHHCSSDNNSLDGLVIKDLKVALIDGTAPHVVDPKNPGAVDEILNLGEFWDEAGLVGSRGEIINFNKEIKFQFYSAYRYLESAKQMQDDIETIIGEAVDQNKFKKTKLSLKNELVDGIEVLDKVAKTRHLFDSAITPDGLVDYIETIIQGNHICYYLKGAPGTGQSEVLDYLAKEYALKGYDIELYHQPLNPERLQTLVVDALKIAITVNPKLEQKAYKIINLNDNMIPGKLADKADLLAKDKEMQDYMMEEAVKRIKTAKHKHDEIEKSYVANMDFTAITQFRNKTVERIKALGEKN